MWRIIAFLSAVLVMIVLGSLAHSVVVQQSLLVTALQAGIAPELTLEQRLQWCLHDLLGMQPLYGILISITLLIALPIASGVQRMVGQRTWVFAAAGATSIFAMFSILKGVLGTVGVFGARGLVGMSTQMFAGVLAALLFSAMTAPRSIPQRKY